MDACHEYTGCSFPHNGFDGRGRGHGAANEIDRARPGDLRRRDAAHPDSVARSDVGESGRHQAIGVGRAGRSHGDGNGSGGCGSRPVPTAGERERYATGAVRQDRQVYGGRRVRRGIREDQPVGWLHGVRQFLVAAVLAGILLAVIVTIKEWNQAPSKATSVAPREHVDVSPMDFGQPELAPAANATLEPPSAPLDTVEASGRTLQGAVPAGMISVDSGPSPHFENTRPTSFEDQPVAPDAAGYADGADPAPRGYGNYPSTGVDPVEVGPLPSGSAAGPAWPTSYGPSSPVRSADRSGESLPYPPQR